MRILKRASILYVITCLLFSTLAISPTFAQDEPTLAAPVIRDPTLTVGATFSIDITVANMTDMWGYEFFLGYDTSVLTATGFASLAPFTMRWADELNDPAGYVYMSYSKQLGQEGENITDPTPIASIDFTVDAIGSSVLDLYGSIISDSVGGEITHTAVDGSFNNAPLEPPVASFYWNPVSPQILERVFFDAKGSYDPDGVITSYFWDFGDGKNETVDKPTIEHIYQTAGTFLVNLTVTDDFDLTDSESKIILIEPFAILAAPDVRDPALIVGATFSTNITIADVTQMWGYQFFLKYDTSILTATGVVSYLPFDTPWAVEIDDVGGFVYMSYSMPLGELDGFNVTAAAPIAGVDWMVDAVGASALDPRFSVVSDVYGGPISHVAAAGSFSNVHDLAVADVEVSPDVVAPGDLVNIKVAIDNEGDFTETFDVTAYYDGTLIGTETVVSLGAGASTNVSLTWDTTGVAVGIYTIRANCTVITGETDTADNEMIDGKVVVATSPLAAPTVVDQTLTAGSSFSINITVANVIDMWGYEFFLAYNTSILNATSYVSYAPFAFKWAAEINETAGFVYMSYSINLGQPGVNITDPTPIASINFMVLEIGTSPLDLYSVVISDSVGAQLPVLPVDGSFDNTPLPTQPPVASFTWTPDTPAVGETVTFNATTSYDPDGTIVTWYWDFGDGTNSTGETVNHVYTDLGTHTVTLTVTDNDGLTDSTTADVTILGYPIASFTISPDPPYTEGDTLTFNASDSTPDGGSLVEPGSYFWDFGDGTNTTGKIVTHTFTEGTYTVTLTVTDSEGLSDSTSQSITVSAIPVVVHDVAVISVTPSPTTVTAGENVTITAIVKNEGTASETFTVNLYRNATQIGSKAVTALAAGSSTTLSWTWDTTDVTAGTYIIKASIAAVAGETDTADNEKTATMTVEEAPAPGIPTEIIVAIIIIIIIVLLIIYYLLRRRRTQAE